MRGILFNIFICLPFFAFPQEQPPYTPASERIASFEQRQDLAAASLVHGIEFRSIGPSVFGGRVADLEVWDEDPTHFYVAYASGGLWKTTNNGTSFEPLFDDQMVMTIGDIAVDWDRQTIWLGSGEVNSSRSSYAGTGLFKSTDGGATWQYLGLGESHHIGRIVLHPEDPNTAWVAALGHLYSPNPERGVYKTTDGGQSWKKVLYVDENTGAVDLIIDPDRPGVLYAATWQRTRRAWNFVESGPGSGIYRSIDGGENWTLLTTADSGFPIGEGAGRIGLALAKDKGEPILYATIDNYFRRPEEAPEPNELTKDQLREIAVDDFLELEDYLLKDYLRSNDFPEKYDVQTVKSLVRNEEITPVALVEYTEDANSLLFDTPVIGLEVYRFDDEGGSWRRTHDDYLDEVYNSYGYYFGQIRVSPANSDRLYLLGVPIIRSDDGGKTFTLINAPNVHADHHALWLNPKREGHLILGNDGGINISYDAGENYIHCNTPPVGQFYYVAVDERDPYRVYGGLQDNGVWMGPSTYEPSVGWHSEGQYPYRRIMGGDGMQVAVDTRDNATVYTGFQFGNYFRLNTETGDRTYITPKHDLGEAPLRWNWQAPIHLSVHNQDILYIGANKLYRSLDRGDNFEAISEDLTQGGLKGDVPYGTLSAIHESPLQFGLIYAGSDDGLLHVTRDGGHTWTRISDDLPDDMWVTRVQASAHEPDRVYVSLNGYRWDDFTAYLYVSEDYGATWTRLGKELPLEPLNVVKEDAQNPDILYVGSDHGLYVSLDRGQSFMLMDNGLPATPVHDVVIHPLEKDIVVGTHGRSIYLGRGKELQQLNAEMLATELHVFAIDPLRASSRWGSQRTVYREPNEPEIQIPVYVATAGKVTITVRQADEDLRLQRFETEVKAGLNYLTYDLTIDPKQADRYEKLLNKDREADDKPVRVEAADNGQTYLQTGEYQVVVKKGGAEKQTTLELK